VDDAWPAPTRRRSYPKVWELDREWASKWAAWGGGWPGLAGPAGLCVEEKKKVGYWATSGEKRRFDLRQFGENRKPLFSNLFINCKSIWIQIKFNISMTSTRTINFKSTSPPKEKYASTWNATNIIIYLYRSFSTILFLCENQGVTVRDSTHTSMYQILPMVLEEHKRDLNFCKWKVIKQILGMGWEIIENGPLYTNFTQIQQDHEALQLHKRT
jgi:hypothetical protein